MASMGRSVEYFFMNPMGEGIALFADCPLQRDNKTKTKTIGYDIYANEKQVLVPAGAYSPSLKKRLWLRVVISFAVWYYQSSNTGTDAYFNFFRRRN